MPKLVPMTQAEYEAFLVRLIPEYAADNVKAGYWDESEANRPNHFCRRACRPRIIIFTLYMMATKQLV